MLTGLTELNSEWAELAGSRNTAQRLAAWRSRVPALHGADDPAQLLERIRERPDEVLTALIALGQEGEPLAVRVVLQAMLGKLVLLCRTRPDRFGEAVSELWLAIAEYPLERRPRSIAANLAWTVTRRLADPFGSAVPAYALAVSATEDASAEATLEVARRLRLIDADTHRVLWLVYVAGLTSARAAAELGTTPEVVRYRCSRTLRRLSGHARLLARVSCEPVRPNTTMPLRSGP